MQFPELPDVPVIVERMRAHINKDFVFENFHRKLTMSIGHGLYPTEELTIESLLHRADLRMYADKHASKYKIKAVAGT